MKDSPWLILVGFFWKSRNPTVHYKNKKCFLSKCPGLDKHGLISTGLSGVVCNVLTKAAKSPDGYQNCERTAASLRTAINPRPYNRVCGQIVQRHLAEKNVPCW